jgi:hypothetical protein
MICCSGIGDRKAKLQAQFTQMRPVVRVAQDAQDLLVECCVWFINLLSSESNEVHSYKQSLLNYILLDIIDVEVHYIVVSAYQYTSLTSVMLRNCWSVPCVIVCSWIFLKAKYGLRNLLGVGVCVARLILVLFSDVHAFGREKGLNFLTGDLLVIGGSMLHAFSRVTKEYFVHESTRVEVMAMLGVFRAIINGIQISIFKQKELRSTHWTADMWAVLMRTIAYQEKVDVMYFISFVGTATGFVIYSYRGSRQNTRETARVTHAMDEEAAAANNTAQVPVTFGQCLQFSWDPGGSNATHRLEGKPNFKKRGMLGKMNESLVCGAASLSHWSVEHMS